MDLIHPKDSNDKMLKKNKSVSSQELCSSIHLKNIDRFERVIRILLRVT